MSSPIIQFGELESITAECSPGMTVRVTTLDMTEESVSYPGSRVAAIGVHIRTITAHNHILSCYLPVARVQVYDGSSPDSQDRQRLDAAWEKAKTLQQRIITYLQTEAIQRDFEIRTDGIIHLDGIRRPMRGRWKADPGPEQGEV